MKEPIDMALNFIKDTARCEALWRFRQKVKKSNKKKFSREELIDMISDEILED